MTPGPETNRPGRTLVFTWEHATVEPVVMGAGVSGETGGAEVFLMLPR